MAVKGKNYLAVVEECIHINAPQQKVFDFLSDFSNYSKMSDAFDESRQTSKGSFGVGTTGIRKARFFGNDFEFTQEVTAYEPPERIVVRNNSPRLQTSDEFICSEEKGGTKVTLRVQGDTRPFMAVMVSLVVAFAQRQIKKDLKRLKEIMEEG